MGGRVGLYAGPLLRQAIAGGMPSSRCRAEWLLGGRDGAQDRAARRRLLKLREDWEVSFERRRYRTDGGEAAGRRHMSTCSNSSGGRDAFLLDSFLVAWGSAEIEWGF